MQLTQHFTLAELCKSDTATRLGINNMPEDWVINNLRLSAEMILEPVRVGLGVPFSPLSGYRGEGIERAITWNKGFKTWCDRKKMPHNEASWDKYFDLKSHPRGEAFDIRVPGISTPQLFKWMQANIFEYDQLIIENYNPQNPMSGWVHASYSSIMNRRQTFELQE